MPKTVPRIIPFKFPEDSCIDQERLHNLNNEKDLIFEKIFR